MNQHLLQIYARMDAETAKQVADGHYQANTALTMMVQLRDVIARYEPSMQKMLFPMSTEDAVRKEALR